MAQLNWTVITYFIVGIFALNGYFRGWWKEAVTTVFLVILVFLLNLPGVADLLISTINTVLQTIWNALPPNLQTLLSDMLNLGLGISTTADTGIQLNPGDPNTWFLVLLVFLIIAILIGRLGLGRDLTKPGAYYYPTFGGSVLGAAVGVLNGYLISNLIREYLDGRSLPGGSTLASTGQITFAGGGSAGAAASSVGIQATDLPSFTILDSFLPWVIVGLGLLILFAVFTTRFSRDGLNIKRRKEAPYGYRYQEVVPKPPAK
ncbi:MAG: hypothetical protein U0401_04360 [Anaerolineae bacterium]